MKSLTPTIKVLRMIQQDCEADSEQLDRTPFTPRGMGETFGNVLAMIAGVAKAVETVAVELEASRPIQELEEE
jgi:hypothetical protein